MRGVILALSAGCWYSGYAFQPSCNHFVQRKYWCSVRQPHHDILNRHRPTWGALFVSGTRTDPATIEHNRQYLRETLGFSDKKLDQIASSTCNILTVENGVLEERVYWVSNRLDLNEASLGKMVQQLPAILSLNVDTNIEPKLDWLQHRLDLDDLELRKMIKGKPTILSYNVNTNIEPKLDWLQQRLDLGDTQLSKMVRTSPSILGYNVDTNIEPKLKWLQQRLDLDDVALSKMVQQLPAILGYNVDTNIEPKLKWLQQRLDLDDVALSKMVQQLPAILGYNVDTNIEPKLKWLQQRLDLDDVALSKLVQQLPAILGYNVDIEPTLNFYIEAMGEVEALALLQRYPIMFSFALEKRLKPRLEQARDAGLTIDAACLRRIGKYTKEEWQQSLVFQSRKIAKEINNEVHFRH